MVIDLKRKYRFKLPDGIIIATAIYLDLPLITADQEFKKTEQLNLIFYER
jgi:predicted nucleic acid-binding protein